MEAEIITKFIPDLVNAISSCVQSISDQCLSKGLIPESTHKQVLESGGTGEDKARILILSVQKSTKTDSTCFEILLTILDEQLPYAIRQKLLLEMRKEVSDRAATVCKAVVPASQNTQLYALGGDSLQCLQQQSSLVGRYENSVSRHAYASAQKTLFEETLLSRTEESGRLRAELETLKSQTHETVSNDKEIATTTSRISACETEMANLKGRIKELECVIEEEGMRARRGRNTIRMETERMFQYLVQQRQQEIKKKEEEFAEVQKEYSREQEFQWRKQEESKLKIMELEHKVALQEKELKIKELELNSIKMEQETRVPFQFETPIEEVVPPELETLGLEAHKMELPHFETPSQVEQPVYSQNDTDTPAGSTLQQHNSLGVPKLKDLLALLRYEVADEWEDIGIQLDFEDGVLYQIKSDNPGDSKRCLRDMLRIWLKRMDPPPPGQPSLRLLRS